MKIRTSLIFIIILFLTACGNEDSSQPKIVKYAKKNDSQQNIVSQKHEESKAFNEKTVSSSFMQADNVLKIGAMDNYSPYIFMEPGGKPGGFDGEMAQEIMKRTDLKYEFVRVMWNKGLQDLKVGELDMLLIAAITPERQKVYNFTDSYILYEVAIVVSEHEKNIKGKTSQEVIKSLFGKKVAISTGYSSLEVLRPYKEIDLLTTPDDKTSFDLLVKAQVDAMALDKLMSLWYIKEHNLPLKVIDTPLSKQLSATMVYKGVNQNIIDKYNAALKKVMTDGTYDTIYKKWFLTDETVPMKAVQINADSSQKNDLLKIGVMDNYLPYFHILPNGKPEGFDVEIVGEIMKRSDFYHSFVPVKWKKGMVDLKAGELSMLIGAAITSERKIHFEFTDSYASYQIVNFVHKNRTDIGGQIPEEPFKSLFGKKVGVTSGYATLENFQKYKDRMNLQVFPNDKLVFQMLEKGEIDSAPNDKIYGLHYIKRHNLPFKAVDIPLYNLPYATAVSKKLDTKILKKYNLVLKTMHDDGTLEGIFHKWFMK